jgi:hypothetical protein
MYLLVVICLFLHTTFQECYGSYRDSPAMSLKTERNLPTIARFVNSQKDAPDNNIKHDWYKRNKNNELLDESENYTDNILRILLEKLVKRFEQNKEDRVDTIIEILEFLNNFIRERFIPTHHQHVFTSIFKHISKMQHTPVMHFESLVFDKLSESAKEKFKDGTRVQTKDLDRGEQNYTNNQFESPDPELVEILFMQLVCDSIESGETRQGVMSQIRDTMGKLERFFGGDANYKLVGNFSSLRATIMKYANNESPLSEIVKFIILLMRSKKHDFQKKYEDLLADNSDSWRKDNKPEKSPVSMWVKKPEIKKPTAAEIEAERKAKEEKEKKGRFKKEIDDAKKGALDNLENAGIGAAKNQFSGIMNSFTSSLKGILPF